MSSLQSRYGKREVFNGDMNKYFETFLNEEMEHYENDKLYNEAVEFILDFFTEDGTGELNCIDTEELKEWFYNKHIDYEMIPEGIILDAMVNSVDWNSDEINDLVWNLRWEAEKNLEEEEKKEDEETNNMTSAEYIKYIKEKQIGEWEKQFA